MLLTILILTAWVRMTFGMDESGRLSAPGIGALKYFTVLSNLLCAAVSLASLIHSFLKKDRPYSRLLAHLRLAGTISVMVTFFVVLLFLGPLFGYAGMYAGANGIFHLLAPLMSLLDYLLEGEAYPLTPRARLSCLIPLGLYGTGYLGNLLLNGVGTWPHTNDFYGFATWGIPAGVGLFAVLGLLTYGFSLSLDWATRFLARHCRRHITV